MIFLPSRVSLWTSSFKHDPLLGEHHSQWHSIVPEDRRLENETRGTSATSGFLLNFWDRQIKERLKLNISTQLTLAVYFWSPLNFVQKCSVLCEPSSWSKSESQSKVTVNLRFPQIWRSIANNYWNVNKFLTSVHIDIGYTTNAVRKLTLWKQRTTP